MADNKRDYYEVLGVDKSATDDVIKKAYRKLAKLRHRLWRKRRRAQRKRFQQRQRLVAGPTGSAGDVVYHADV